MAFFSGDRRVRYRYYAAHLSKQKGVFLLVSNAFPKTPSPLDSFDQLLMRYIIEAFRR